MTDIIIAKHLGVVKSTLEDAYATLEETGVEFPLLKRYIFQALNEASFQAGLADDLVNSKM